MNNITKRLIQKGSLFELQDAVINGVPCKTFPHGPKTLLDIFLKAAAFKDEEFIIWNDNRLSFGLVFKKAKQLALVLQKQYCVKKNNRVALLMDNSPEWIIAFIAIYFSGAVPVILHADSGKQVVARALEITNCSLVLSDKHNITKLENYKCPILLLFNNKILNDHNKEINSYFIDFSEVPYIELDFCLDKTPKPENDDEALISFTSGTTGTPKGVVLSHRNMTTGLMNMMLGGFMMNHRNPKARKYNNRTTGQPCSLLLSPLSHIGGYSQILLMCYLRGKIVMMDSWNACSAAKYIENEKVASLSGASVEMIRELVGSDAYNEKLATIKNININGVALKKEFIEYVAEKLPAVTVATGYGMTETCGSISNVTGTELLHDPNWIGPVIPSVDIKIIDESGNEQSSGNPGEVCVRGSMVMKEYCSDPDKTIASLKNGWLKTGDLGYIDSDGKLYITDRIKDIIICNNQCISASELENMAIKHPMVDEAVVLGIPNSERCEKIVMTILTKNNLQNEELKLEREFSSIINKYSADIKVICIDFLPRNAIGKINRNELRKKILAKL